MSLFICFLSLFLSTTSIANAVCPICIVGSGLGLRYDFDFFVFRIDLGYKTYDPGREIGDRWFRGINFGKTVLNFGINYPF